MPLDSTELIIGPAFVSLDGVDMGFVGSDGITYSPEWETTEFESSQTAMVVDAHRTRIRGVISATFHQLSLEKWRMLEDIKNAPVGNTLVGSWDICGSTKRVLVLTMPAPNCGVRTMSATAVIITPGEKVFNNGEYTGAPVEFLLLGNAEDESLWTMIETPSAVTVPAPSTFAFVVDDVETAFVDGASTVSATSDSVQMNFNVAVRPDQLSDSKFILLVSTTGEVIPATYAYGETGGVADYTKVKIIPTGGFTASTGYSVVMPAGIVSTTGKRSAASSVQFTTTA